MRSRGQCHRRAGQANRLVVWGLFLVLLGGLAGGVYWFRNRDIAEVDAELLNRLRGETLAPAAEADDLVGQWPQWRGPRRDGVSREKGILQEWPAQGPRVLWTVPLGPGYSSLAVAAGKLFTLMQAGDDEAVVCLDAASGQKLWEHRYRARFRGDYGNGPRSTPTADGDRVYTVGATGVLHCLDAETGTVRWHHDLLTEFRASNLRWGVSFSPLVEGDLVVTNPGGPDGHSVVAFDKHDGRVIWHALDDPAGYSSPIAATLAGARQVLCFTARGLVALAPADGRELWRWDWITNYDVNAATPIVIGEYVFISSAYGSGCALLRVERQPDGRIVPRRVYRNNRMQNKFSSSVLTQDLLFGFSSDRLTCLELRTGELRWKESGFDQDGSVLAVGDRLIVLGANGVLSLVAVTGEEFREKGRRRVSDDSDCWAVPALAEGRLYVRDNRQLTCLDMVHP